MDYEKIKCKILNTNSRKYLHLFRTILDSFRLGICISYLSDDLHGFYSIIFFSLLYIIPGLPRALQT